MVTEGARAWGHSSCGLHIHVSREAFASKSHQWRFAHIHASVLNKELEKIAGRKGITHYCAFPHESGAKAPLVDPRGRQIITRDPRTGREIYEEALELPQKIIAGKQMKYGREVAVNVNEQTIELRFWKGSLNPNTVLGAAAIEDALIQWTRNMPFSVIKAVPTWIDFMIWCKSNVDAEQFDHIANLAQARGITSGSSTETDEV
jgi:hypothetical protein